MRSLLLGTTVLAFMAFFSTEASAQGGLLQRLRARACCQPCQPAPRECCAPAPKCVPCAPTGCTPCSSGCTGSQGRCEWQLAQDQAICERFRDNPAIYQRCMQAANIVYQDCLEGKLRPMRDPMCPVFDCLSTEECEQFYDQCNQEHPNAAPYCSRCYLNCLGCQP